MFLEWIIVGKSVQDSVENHFIPKQELEFSKFDLFDRSQRCNTSTKETCRIVPMGPCYEAIENHRSRRQDGEGVSILGSVGLDHVHDRRLTNTKLARNKFHGEPSVRMSKAAAILLETHSGENTQKSLMVVILMKSYEEIGIGRSVCLREMQGKCRPTNKDYGGPRSNETESAGKLRDKLVKVPTIVTFSNHLSSSLS